ncbi:MAG TPA: VOC family protein [Actinomycetes bacterium]
MDVTTTKLRAEFARRLSAMYGGEVPLYTTLVDVAQEVNEAVLAAQGDAAQRLGSIERVTAERHGAIRVGTPDELRQVGQVFAAMGMHPVGFYDLRDAGAAAVPVVSTAFRPVDADELAANPFRVFVSVLATDDRRFFTADLQSEVEAFLAERTLFPAELLEVAAQAEADEGLRHDDAGRFLELATGAFALSREPIDRRWYERLEQVSGVAADIGGVTSTHVNHLTPRVLDIDMLYARMRERGVEMIDEIQGPPLVDGPAVLLRQTSFRALAEPRMFREPDGTVGPGALRVRFGEVEARGVALTPSGRDRYDATGVADLPRTERDLALDDLAYYTVEVRTDRPQDGRGPVADLAALLDGGWVSLQPVVYEDFLPRSAAGIFRSNLARDDGSDRTQEGTPRDVGWVAAALDRRVHDLFELYAAQRDLAWQRALRTLGLVNGPKS